MRKLASTILILSLTACAVVALWPGPSSAAEAEEAASLRVGVFDTRAVAIAYAKTPAFRERIMAMKNEHRRAEQSGDEELAAELEERGQTMQHRMHLQGFGTCGVEDILETVQDELPVVAARANVDVIVSKWTVSFVGDGAELVDVTELMVRLFDPSDEMLAGLEEIAKVDPVPMEELRRDHHH